MNLLEYEAKKILRASDISVPHSTLLGKGNSLQNVSLPSVMKSQVPTGGRGKLGGVKIVKTVDELERVSDSMLAHEIKGFVPKTLLAEEVLDIDKEFYLALLINRTKHCIELSAHADGGVDVESHAASDFLHFAMTDKNANAAGETLAEIYGLPEQTFALQDLIEKLYDCFVSQDATLLEINPLILTTHGELIAGDCKMILDDAAAFRHPDWNFEEKSASANFVSLDDSGTVATIANGAGLAMATVDAVTSAGYSPANFLDIGGNATTEQVVASFKKIMEFPAVDAIVINIFGGIVRCDTVAQAIIEAKSQLPNLPRLIIRLSGNRSDEAAKLLKEHDLPLYRNLTECIEALS
jgi:succinyl-CoA synthetase beta subunit